MSVASVVYCQVGVCVRMITRPEESYRVWVSECDREALIMMRPWPATGCCAMRGENCVLFFLNRRWFYFQCKPATINVVIRKWA